MVIFVPVDFLTSFAVGGGDGMEIEGVFEVILVSGNNEIKPLIETHFS